MNKALIFSWLRVDEAGEMVDAQAVARKLDEAKEMAGRLRDELARRGIHPTVLEFCRAELPEDDYSHSVPEATKSVAERVRQMSGLQSAGCPLVDDAFDTKSLRGGGLRTNGMESNGEINAHKGFADLLTCLRFLTQLA